MHAQHGRSSIPSIRHFFSSLPLLLDILPCSIPRSADHIMPPPVAWQTKLPRSLRDCIFVVCEALVISARFSDYVSTTGRINQNIKEHRRILRTLSAHCFTFQRYPCFFSSCLAETCIFPSQRRCYRPKNGLHHESLRVFSLFLLFCSSLIKFIRNVVLAF